MKYLLHTFAAALLILPLLVTAADGININTASKDQLMQLNGVGETRAEAILEYRDKNDGFTSVEELTEVSGIGESTLQKNRDMLTTGKE